MSCLIPVTTLCSCAVAVTTLLSLPTVRWCLLRAHPLVRCPLGPPSCSTALRWSARSDSPFATPSRVPVLVAPLSILWTILARLIRVVGRLGGTAPIPWTALPRYVTLPRIANIVVINVLRVLRTSSALVIACSVLMNCL